MKLLKQFAFVIMLFTAVTVNAQVGIGTTTPLARLQVTDSSVLFSAAGSIPTTPGNTPISGAGRRMMWYPDKAAFRVGYVDGTQWDRDNIGSYSFASGIYTKAIGDGSISMGLQTTATGLGSISMGKYTIASGDYSTAIGNNTTASGISSTAIGNSTTASGAISTAMGNITTASGNYSTAIGTQTIASGANSVAIGTLVSTNGHTGSFFFGDSDPNNKGLRITGVDNEFAARFNGGYFFITSNAGSDIGVRVAPGGNSWSTISDVNRKENFEPVNGDDFLEKIASFNLSSWNYKGQDAKTFRHYGPMAQEFYKAFGKDDYGIIGCDTLINQQDFLGVNLIAIQALEKRTVENKKETDLQNIRISDLQKENEDLKTRLDKLERMIANKQ
ncbi:MAG: tail fiber domain-containing protein [Ginsengibacter sp.]